LSQCLVNQEQPFSTLTIASQFQPAEHSLFANRKLFDPFLSKNLANLMTARLDF
jgi:hypothetical protein